MALEGTYNMDRVGHVHMDPHTRPVEAQVSTYEQAGARALGVLPVLSKNKKGHNYEANIIASCFSANDKVKYNFRRRCGLSDPGTIFNLS